MRRPKNPKGFGLPRWPVEAYPYKGPCWHLAEKKPLSPHPPPPSSNQRVTGRARTPFVVTAGYTPCEAIARGSVTVHHAHSPDVAAGSSLHSTGRMSVGVAVKPPDESFRRLETTPPRLSIPFCATVQIPILGGGCLTDAARGLDGPGVLSLTHRL